MAEITSSSPDDEQDTGPGAGNLANGRVADLIEQLKQRSAELEEANRELRRVSHYRSLFLARMSHELRTPLTSILGFTEILLDQEQLTDSQRRFCQKIQDSGMQLQSSLNQLVDLSRLEAGQSELFFQEFPLREMLRDSCTAVARSAQKQQVNVEYDLAPQITTIVSDQGKLRQVLYSFLAWSISRSGAGNTVRIYAELNGSAMLRLRITDDGEPVSSLSRVFDPESIGSEEPDVNDLGIIIGRRLVDILHGTVTIQYRDGSGMETILEIPARPSRG
jgi:signal transduction histidine kinase